MNILLIAYFFPPDVSSGAFRPLHFARYFTKMGENVCVLTVREDEFLSYQKKDHALLHDELLEHVHIARTGMFYPHLAVVKLRDALFSRQHSAQQQTHSHSSVTTAQIYGSSPAPPSSSSVFQNIKDAITDCLSIPDQQIGWLVPAVKRGRKLIREKGIDGMYATGNPWTSLLVGSMLKKLTGIPLVLDFRDPWVSNHVFTAKRPFVRKIETFLERRVVQSADHIIANTQELRNDFLRRYSNLSAEQVTAIPNGFEAYLDVQPPHNDKLTLTHTGTLNERSPARLLQALIDVVENNEIPQEHLRIIFLGGISAKDAALQELLQHPIIQEIVEVLPRMPYQEAFTYQKLSDVLFLVQPPHFSLQVPRKVYEYIAFQKTIFGITNPDGATGKIIDEIPFGVVAADETPEITTALKSLYHQWQTGTLNSQNGRKDDDRDHPGSKPYDTYLNSQLTQELLKVFRKCVT